MIMNVTSSIFDKLLRSVSSLLLQLEWLWDPLNLLLNALLTTDEDIWESKRKVKSEQPTIFKRRSEEENQEDEKEGTENILTYRK